MSAAQNVTTWHNDNNRTGWQQNETVLNTSSVSQSTFGLLWQWSVTGRIYSQPLAVGNLPTVGTCQSPCSLIFVATEQGVLYAFNATSYSQTPVWSINLAEFVGGAAIDCSQSQNENWSLCQANDNTGLFGQYVGVTGTPVIDTSKNILYVAEAAEVSSKIGYYLVAVSITSGSALNFIQISGTVPGQLPAKCQVANPLPGNTITFDANHIQRSALLLLNGAVYVAFADLPEATENGWLFGYTFNGSAFSQTAAFTDTPYGTGGGIWMAGAGPASDGSYIYVTTANGTFQQLSPADGNAPFEGGDSLLKLNPSSLTIQDYYTPSDVYTYNNNGGLCDEDEDFGSGGVLLFPDAFYNSLNLTVNADKQSNLYVANTASLGGFNSSGGNNIQTTQTPPIPQNDPTQGYWASPAYWKYTSGSTTNYMLYYSATMQSTSSGVTPEAINGYQLLTSGSSGPIPTTYTSTQTLFCDYSPTPSVSSNGTQASSGIVWAVESNQNSHNNGQYKPPDCAGTIPPGNPSALHAFNATTLVEIYTSRLVQTTIPHSSAFPTPTVFNGYVYFGGQGQVNVFGLCVNGEKGQCKT